MEFDWRVDVKSASDNVSRMSVPTCILQLKVCDNNKSNNNNDDENDDDYGDGADDDSY